MHSNKRSFTPWVAGALGAFLLAGSLPAQQGSPYAPFGVDTAGMDRTVRPQDDFFRYVNGSWLRNTPIPSDRSNHGTFSILADESARVIRAIVEEAAAAPNRARGSDLQKVGDFYASYMDTARIERLGLQPLRAELARIAAVRGKAALPETFAHLQGLGVQVPFGAAVRQDARNAAVYALVVSQSGLGLPDRGYYFGQEPRFAEARAAYQTYAETLLRLAGQPDPAGAARNILALETSLAQAHWERARSRDREATYNRFTPTRLDSLTPNFSWAGYLRAAGAPAGTAAVIVSQPDYFQVMDRTLGQVPLESWKQYMTFKLLDAYADEMSRAFDQAKFAFADRTLRGLEQQSPRWQRGVEAVEGSLGFMAGRMYAERTFTPEKKARMQQLVGNLLSAFRQGIDELEWMSPDTRTRAKEKLSRINVKIGYPDKWMDYTALEVRPGDAVGNQMRAAGFAFRRQMGRIGKPVDRTEWGMTPQTVNAYYNANMNEIVFPAAILQPPFFNPDADDAVNYGGIGGVIGHEISHGFDDQGRRSDGEGNLRDWWGETDNAAFQQRADALVAQYGALSPLEGVNVNGRFTLGENIGDVSGLAVAYKAYRLSLGGREAPVVGGFTGDQRFFMGWAQVWRRRYRDADLRQRILTDPHSPAEFRTNGVLRNMPQFYAAFGVKEGDAMYLPAEKRVKIW